MKEETREKQAARAKAEDLLDACNAGNRQALEKLAGWCMPRVRRTVMLSYGGGPETDDLVQNAMSRIFSRLSTFRGEASFYIWVDRITINVCKDHFKRKKLVFYKEEIPEDADPGDTQKETRPDIDFERYRLFERLSEHFAAIHPKRRLPLVLSLFQGYTVPEIAAMLDLSFDAAKMRLRRGRGDLLRRLKADPYCEEAIRELAR